MLSKQVHKKFRKLKFIFLRASLNPNPMSCLGSRKKFETRYSYTIKISHKTKNRNFVAVINLFYLHLKVFSKKFPDFNLLIVKDDLRWRKMRFHHNSRFWSRLSIVIGFWGLHRVVIFTFTSRGTICSAGFLSWLGGWKDKVWYRFD